MMRLSLIPWSCGVVALLATPAAGQHRLPARSFEPSLAVAPTAPVPVAEWWRNGGPRIRPTDQRATSMLRSGIERSHRLRALVDGIDAANVVVYLGLDPRLDNGLAGRLTFMGNAGKYRYVRVALNPRLSADVMIAALAHELQHVAEVIAHPEVTSERTLRILYERIGHTARTGSIPGWETAAAREVTHEVRRELAAEAVAALARRDPSPAPESGQERRWERF
jgi:hypothetical protein